MPRLKSALLALSLLLAACTAGSSGSKSLSSGSIYWTYYDTSYTPIQDIAMAGGSGQLLTQVLGNPFDVDQEQFDKAVTDAMYGAHFGPATHFTTTPNGSFKRKFYVRLAFDGAGINSICTSPPSAAGAQCEGDRLRHPRRCLLPGRRAAELSGGGRLGLQRADGSALRRVHA